jgi:biopolymer transport protein ExbB/TolQ
MTDRWKNNFAQAMEWFMESRGNPEGRRVLLLALLSFLAWGLGLFFLSGEDEMASRVALQASRFANLVEVSQAYRALPPSQRDGSSPGSAKDPLSSASETIERLRMKNRLKGISGSNRGISLALEGLGQEEMITLARELEKARLAILSAEIRALPVEGKRLLSVNLLLGGTP